VPKLKYLGTAAANQNSIYEEIKNRLNPGMLVLQSLLSSRLLSETLKIQTYKNIF
jgi:hypothetical protein